MGVHLLPKSKSNLRKATEMDWLEEFGKRMEEEKEEAILAQANVCQLMDIPVASAAGWDQAGITEGCETLIWSTVLLIAISHAMWCRNGVSWSVTSENRICHAYFLTC